MTLHTKRWFSEVIHIEVQVKNLTILNKLPHIFIWKQVDVPL